MRQSFSPACAGELAAAVQAKWALRLEIWKAGTITMVREGTDRYGRALIDAFLDGEPLARRMIAAGHGRSYDGGRRKGLVRMSRRPSMPPAAIFSNRRKADGFFCSEISWGSGGQGPPPWSDPPSSNPT